MGRNSTMTVRAHRFIPAVLLALCVAALLAPSVASAAFTRQSLRQITRTENTAGKLNTTPCSEAEAKTAGSPCLSPGGIAIDKENDLWVENQNSSLAEFGPAYAPGDNEFLKTLTGIEGPDNLLTSLAIENTSDDFYNIGEGRVGALGEGVEVYDKSGTKLREDGRFRGGRIAIDNSPMGSIGDSSACGTLPLAAGECFVYVTEFGESGGISKLNSKGEAEPFAFAKECKESPKCYVEGSKISGIPGKPEGVFGGEGLIGIAVDPEGNIYAANSNRVKTVYEYSATGKFVQEFNLEGSEVPRLEGFVVEPTSVAVDPASGHLLVAVVNGQGGKAGAIDEFDTATGKFVAEITGTSSGGRLERPVGITADSQGDVYVSDRMSGLPGEAVIDVYGSGRFDPTVTLGAAGERKPTSAVLNGAVNPEGLELSECEFQYVPQTQFEEEKGEFKTVSTREEAGCVPAAGSIAATGTTPVSANIAGLQPGTTYHYRLLARSEGELGGTAETAPLAFTAPGAPAIFSISATNLSSTFADLHAQIAPRGAGTTYRFEYLSASAFAANGNSFSGPEPVASTPTSGASIGSGGPTGGMVESVVQHIGPLAPGSIFYYRVNAENAQGVASGGICAGASEIGPYCTFATLPVATRGLPDGRSYELVTPATKEGGADMFGLPENDGEFFNKDVGAPAEDGNGFLLDTFSPFGPFPAAGRSAYVFHRDPEKSEWAFKSLASPSLGVQSINEAIFDPFDLSRVGIEDAIGSEVTEEGGHADDLLGAPGGEYTELHVGPTVHQKGNASVEGVEETKIVGGSRDLSHVILESEAPTGQTDKACPGAEGVKHGAALCEAVNGETRLVNVNDEGEPLSRCGAQLGARTEGGTHQAVSTDGSRVFFVAPSPGGFHEAVVLSGPGCWTRVSEHAGRNPPQLYVRIDGTSTLDVSEAEPGLAEAGSTEPDHRPAPYRAEFVGASEDGSRVFFVTDAWLTADHPQVHDPELYECQIIQEEAAAKCQLTRISAGDQGEPGENEGAQLFGVQAVAREGTAVYFLGFGALTPGASPQVRRDVDTGAPVNLYRYQVAANGTSAHTSYVATVSTNNRSNETACSGIGPCNEENWYSTPDGNYLLFASEADLTANARTEGSMCKVPGSQNARDRCSELYRYDARAAEENEPSLVCVSCDPGGRVPTGNALFTRSASETGSRPATPVRAMSNDGAFVFFDTPTPLVAGATNGSLNVYEWHGGTISLLDSGAESGASYFLGYSPFYTPDGAKVEGGNVFVGTHDKLAAAATSTVGNIYDARICVAESPCIQPPPGETAQCEGSACQTPPTAPVDPTSTLLPSGVSVTPSISSPQKRTMMEGRTEKLTKALRACKKDKKKAKRTACERQARKRYAPVKKTKRATVKRGVER